MLRYFVVPFIIALVGALLLMQFVQAFDLLAAWLLSITLVTFGTYGYDKAIAGSSRFRMPENALLALTFFGGTIGAIAGMRFFHHKTKKRSFQAKFFAILAVQILLIFAYYWFKNRASG